MYNSYIFQCSDTPKKDIADSIRNNLTGLFQANMSFFSRALPEISLKLASCNSKNYSLFINDSDALNILDNRSGEALYGTEPAIEAENEVSSFLKNPLVVRRDSKQAAREIGFPDKAVVLVFGVGCGYHLKKLLLSDKLSALLIYETDIELLKCSLNFILWQDLLEIANAKNVLLAIQPDYAVTNITAHLTELAEAGLFTDEVYLYRHTYHVIAEEVFRFLLNASGNSSELLQGNARFLGLDEARDYLPVRPAGILGNATPDFEVPDRCLLTFKRNLKVLRKFYPEIATFYENYQPKRWKFCIDEEQRDNIYHIPSRTFAYVDVKQESESLAKFFIKNPYSESIVYSQSYQPKLAKYIHFKQILKVEKLQQSLPEKQIRSKDDIRTLSFFGTGLAKYIDYTLAEINPTNIFIFEEDPDLFYASLYVTAWDDLIKKINLAKGRLYFNIGSAPNDYIKYFLHQLHMVGAHEISNAFIFPSYYRPDLQKAIGELRAQLKTFIALNEYYDNARYGITHFIKNSESSALFFRLIPDKKNTDVPVFIVGNGPSLDALVEHIKNYQNDAIIISCGTALKALYEYGITPDFHAEVEQNSSTYKWINSVPDKAYLKSINFLSVASAFPETTKLFKRAYLNFTYGQSPIKSLALVDENEAVKMSLLQYAFPTVSNFAISVALSIGFKDLYLFGVDLGFSDIEHHHSKKSIYYNAQGNQNYDYAKSVGDLLRVKGNFLPYVYTKFEFNMARLVMEQAITSFGNTSQVYNCSEGAYIKGTTPLPAESILIKSQGSLKNEFLESLLIKNFSSVPETSIASLRNYIFENIPRVVNFINSMLDLFSVKVTSRIDANEFISQHNLLLRKQYCEKNILACYLLEGSLYSFLGLMNSFSSALDEKSDFTLFNQLLSIWQEYLVLVRDDLNNILDTPCPVVS